MYTVTFTRNEKIICYPYITRIIETTIDGLIKCTTKNPNHYYLINKNCITDITFEKITTEE